MLYNEKTSWREREKGEREFCHPLERDLYWIRSLRLGSFEIPIITYFFIIFIIIQ